MNLPLIIALCLSVVGWTMALVYFRKYKRALRSAVRAMNETQAWIHSIHIERMVTQQILDNLRSTLGEDPSGDEWKYTD